MRWRIVGVVVLFIASGEAIPATGSPPPAWMVRGFEATIADPKAEVGANQLGFSDWLLRAIPADKLLPLPWSKDSDLQAAAALALAGDPAP